jgi:hypothetical protein
MLSGFFEAAWTRTMRFWALAALIVGLTLVLCPFAYAAEGEAVEVVPPEAYTRGAEPLEEGNFREELVSGFVETFGTPARVQLQFGLTKAYGRHAYQFEDPYAYNGDAPVGDEGIAGRLRPDTTYHYQLVAWNEAGKSFGADRTFRTQSRKPRSRSTEPQKTG